MTLWSRLASRSYSQALSLVLAYSFVLSICAPFTASRINAAPRTAAATRAAKANSSGSLNTENPAPSPDSSPSPEPTASPSPEPTSSATPEPSPEPTPEPMPSPPPVIAPTPTQGVPDTNLPNLDTLRNTQPVEPEMPDAAPSNTCSPAQPDCNPEQSAQKTFSRSLLSRRPSPQTRLLPELTSQLLAWNPNSFSYENSREVLDVAVPGSAMFGAAQPFSPLQSGGGSYSDFVMARLDPDNRIGGGGEDPLSRNFNWSLPLVSMSGRSGLNLGLTLSYNSLVWTKADNYITFDADNGYPTPGFRLGFPVIYGTHLNSQTGTYGFLMLMPSGSRVELRRVANTNVYEAADSSYLHLIDNGNGSLRVINTDGTQLSYTSTQNGYRCTQVKDRNGNYITISNSAAGRMLSVTDTLGRVFNFNYDTNNNLTSISQTRGSSQYTWVTFGYTNLTLQTNFPTSLIPIGTQHGATLPVLSLVGLADGTYYKFSYTTWGQVHKITYYAADSNPSSDNHALSYVSYNLPLNATTEQADCPRFTQRKVWAENWVSGAEVATNYTVPTVVTQLPDGTNNSSWKFYQVNTPDGVYYNIYSPASGWKEGMPVLEDTWADSNQQGLALQRTVKTDYTQDNTGVAYILNPRVNETKVQDPSGNLKRTTVGYTSFTLSCGTDCDLTYHLPNETKEYNNAGTSVLRTTQTDYNLDFNYTSRRIFGLTSQKRVYNTTVSDSNLVSKVEYFYDSTGEFLVQQGTPIQHDATNYGSSFAWRGNMTRVKRWDVINTSESVETKTGYNTTGSPIFTRDPLSNQASISYTDSFSDTGGMNTYAFPTSVTDADGYQATSQYSYHVGVVTRKQGPPPANTTAAYFTFSYDSVGRLYQVTNSFNSASATYLYPTSSNVVQIYTTVQNGLPATVSSKILDGAGRVRAAASEHPGSEGGYVGQYFIFDNMGRLIKKYNPTEISGAWNPSGADSAGWFWTEQTYDWKGRPRVFKNQDGTTKQASYGGCGCAGGEVITITDELGRKQRATHDELGRVVMAEEFEWNGTDHYRTTKNTYNALDQVTFTKQYDGPSTSSVYQETALTYDGYGRLKTRRLPQNATNTLTTYDYYADGAVQKVTDARGATTNYTYNNRRMVTGISYGVPSGSNITVPSSISYSYDAAGNRTLMTDGFGDVTYTYNSLSQLTSETRDIDEISKSYTFNYTYNLGGQLTSLSDPNDTARNLTYVYNQAGRLTTINGNGFANVTQYASNLQTRAWGALKHLTYGNGKNLDYEHNLRQQVSGFEVNGVMRATFQYYADGRIKFVNDLSMEIPASDKFDRSYAYDYVGRLVEAKSGTEAHTPSVTTDNRPYREIFGFDEWNNLTSRTGRVWAEDMLGFSASYTNNRRSDWTYDADGRTTVQGTNGGTLTSTYDASGQLIKTFDTAQRGKFSPGLVITQGYDGNGQRVKQQETTNPNLATYLIRSTAMGGEAISEIGRVNNQWQKKTGFVLVGGQILATQTIGIYGNVPLVNWMYRNPVTSSERGVVESELDPLGLDAGLAPPDSGYTNTEASDLVFPRFGDIMNGSTGCTLNGFMVSCATVMMAQEVGFVHVDEPTALMGPKRPQRSVNPQSVPSPSSAPTQAFSLGSASTASGIGIPWLEEHVEVPGELPQDILETSFGLLVNGIFKSFRDCVNEAKLGSEAANFNEEAANLIQRIHVNEGISREALAVTWMNENSDFSLYPDPNTNGAPENIDKWDVGPFQINVEWTVKVVAAGEANYSKGLTIEGVYGYSFYYSDMKTPAPFNGDPLSNGRMGARRIKAAPGKTEEDRVTNYTKPSSRAHRRQSYRTYAPQFKKFFECFKG